MLDANRSSGFQLSPKVEGMTGGKQWETNLAAVWGQMATGGGHKPFAEMMAVLNSNNDQKIVYNH